MSPVALPGSSSILPYLGVFHAMPEAGSILFPARATTTEPSPTAAFLPRLLTRESLSEFQETSRRLLQETAQAAFDGVVAPSSLPTTKGQWLIEESFGEDYVMLRRFDGRFLFLYQGERRIESALGWKANGVAACVANTCHLEEASVSTSYHFGFFSTALERLRASLRRKGDPLPQVALEMAARIYASDQYPPGFLPQRMGYANDTSRYRPLGDLKELANAVLSSSDKIWLFFGAKPLATVPGTMVSGALAGGREYLDLILDDEKRNEAGELMPLSPQLKDQLWNLAECLAASSLRVFES